MGSLHALVSLFISGGINSGNNPDLSVTYSPSDHSITCVVSILGAIVSRQFLIPNIGLAIQSRRILPRWICWRFKCWVSNVSFDARRLLWAADLSMLALFLSLTVAMTIRLVRDSIFVLGCIMHDADRVPIVQSPAWSVGSDGKISGQWKNGDGSTSPVSCAYNAEKNSFVLTDDNDSFCSKNSGWEPVV